MTRDEALGTREGSPLIRPHPRSTHTHTRPPHPSANNSSAPHCVEYAHLILWSRRRQGEEFDPDCAEHMAWVHERAAERAAQYGIAVSKGSRR